MILECYEREGMWTGKAQNDRERQGVVRPDKFAILQIIGSPPHCFGSAGRDNVFVRKPSLSSRSQAVKTDRLIVELCESIY